MVRALPLLLLLLGTCAARDRITVQLHNLVVSERVLPNFASFSYEISGFISMAGSPTKGSYVQLLENLRAPSNSAGPVLRLGGNSADVSWWNPDHLPMPPNVTYSITQNDITAYVQFARAAPHSKFVIDTSLYQQGNASWAVAHLQAIQKGLGWDSLVGVEIGNEVDLFYENGLRPSTYKYDNYKRDFALYSQAIYSSTSIPTPFLQGGTFCCNHFDSGIDDYLHTFRNILKTFSYHAYPQSACHGNTPSLFALMNNAASDGVAARMKPYAVTARSLGISYVMGETNSVSCGGQSGISDVFASALWAVDYFFALAATNISMVNLHGGFQPYSPISYSGADRNVPDIRPLYYAMLMFSEATANASVVLGTSVASTQPLIKAWAVKDSNEQRRVVVIHKALNQTEPCDVTVAAEGSKSGSATLLRLHVPKGDYHSKYGVEWAGQTFDGTQDGKPSGTRVTESVPFSGGAWTFTLQPGTAAMLILPQPLASQQRHHHNNNKQREHDVRGGRDCTHKRVQE